MNIVYRLKEGQLTSDQLSIPILFGLVSEDLGFFYLDLYVRESVNLKSILEEKRNILLGSQYQIKALTDERNEIEVTKLQVRNVSSHKSFMRLQSYGYLQHTEVRKQRADEPNNNNKREEFLYYLELEGLFLEYTDFTVLSKSRRGTPIEDFNDHIRDHTSALLMYDNPDEIGCNNFLFTFSKSATSDNIIVTLPNSRDKSHDPLLYDYYKTFKRELISMLSFVNGAAVAVRKEFVGGFYSIDKVHSQSVITYSYRTFTSKSHCGYVPLNDSSYRADRVLSHIFFQCFTKYVEENRKLDLESIVFYLNGAYQAKTVEEKFFILIIAFERLAQKYIDTRNVGELLLLPDEQFTPIKVELFEVIGKYRAIYPDKIESLKGKIGDLNKIKKSSTKFKFVKLLEYAYVDSTNDIEKILDEVRHKSVHHGDIGRGQEAIKNYLVLDELLRDIILNIIGYNKSRDSRYKITSV